MTITNPTMTLRAIVNWTLTLREAEDDRVRFFADLLQHDLEQLFDGLNQGVPSPDWSLAAEMLRAEPLASDPYEELRREQETLRRRMAHAKETQAGI